MQPAEVTRPYRAGKVSGGILSQTDPALAQEEMKTKRLCLAWAVTEHLTDDRMLEDMQVLFPQEDLSEGHAWKKELHGRQGHGRWE